MEVKIGVQYAARELTIETNETSEAIEKVIADAVAGEGGILALTDSKGRKIVVPADKIAYVEIGGGVAGSVGFKV